MSAILFDLTQGDTSGNTLANSALIPFGSRPPAIELGAYRNSTIKRILLRCIMPSGFGERSVSATMSLNLCKLVLYTI